MSAFVNYEIEEDWDYAYVSINGLNVQTSLSTTGNPNGNNQGFGITGFSNGWVELQVDVTAYQGQGVTIGFHYVTDGYVSEKGISIDDINVPGQALEGAENSGTYWSLDNGFRVVGTLVEVPFEHYYMLEYKAYKNYDVSMMYSGFDFMKFRDDRERLIEKFPYQEGLLIWYWDTSFSDNNFKDHCDDGRCGGMILPIDAHPEINRNSANEPVSASVAVYDATFSLEPTEQICQHYEAPENYCIGPFPGVSVFTDVDNAHYLQNEWPYQGANLEPTGTRVEIITMSAQRNFMKIKVTGPTAR